MKFTIERDRLLQTINDCLRAISSKAPIPILSGLKLTINEKGLTVIGSDSNISIVSFIPIEEDGNEIIELKQQGTIVINARIFSDIIRKLPTDQVDISVNEQLVTTIKSGKSEFKINGLNVDEYPQLADIEENQGYTLPADLLKNMIRQTVFAVSTAETRPILTGVNWKIHNQELICSATDSHRLARKTIPFESNEEIDIVIPGKALNEISKLLGESNQSVQVFFTHNQILFKMKNILFYSRLLEGNYPDINRLIPNEHLTEIKINTKDLYHAIDRASLLARENRNNVVKLTSKKGFVEISSSTPEIGTVMEEVTTNSLEGEEIEISFSGRYILDAIRAIHDEEINIAFTGIMKPFVIKGEEDNSMIQLILPVRTV